MSMRINKLLLIFLILFLSSCGGITKNTFENNSGQEENSDKSDSQTLTSDGIDQYNTETPLPISISATSTKKPINTFTCTPTSKPNATATLTATIQINCQPPEGYIWSKSFSDSTSYITNILPAGNGDFLISGELDERDGIWVSKITSKGELIWQKKFKPAAAFLKPAPNGNFVIEFQNKSIEIDEDGNIIQSLDTPQMMPNQDGSYTIIKDNQVMRYQDPENPDWGYAVKNSDIFAQSTTDGGAIYAYAGIYADDSVYYRPIYTDIKVIKIDAYGQVWQRVYGKLVGDETLDFVLPTADGGALLAGVHYYEQLGSDYDIWLMKINQTGSLSWQSTLKMAPQMDSISQIFVLSNGYLIISEDYSTNQQRLVKLNNNGTLGWQKELYSIRGRISIDTVSAAKDGGILLTGSSDEKTSVGFLAHFNSRGEIIWEKLTGFYGIEQTPKIFIQSIYPTDQGSILISGSTNLTGPNVTDTYSAWIAEIKDEGDVLGFLQISPGKFSVIGTMGSRPNTLPDEVFEINAISFSEITTEIEAVNFNSQPVCLPSGVTYPTPQALPSLTPSITPTPSFQRDLFLTEPDNMQGDDVLLMQQRLLELGYVEVGIPDRIFGKKTDNAVRLFQEYNDLYVDGIVGSKTWNKLFSESAISRE